MKGKAMEKEDQSCDVCIVCALPEEAEAVIKVVGEQCNGSFEKRTSPRYGYSYRSATITNHKKEPLHLHLSWLPRYGPQEMTLHLTHVLEEYQPRFVLMTGICAGDAQEVQLGDLIVAERVFTYDGGKFTRKGHQHDTRTYELNANLLGYLRMFDEWKTLVGSLERPVSQLHQIIRNEVLCHIKSIASGNAVRADNPFKDVQVPVRNAVAIDMESAALGRVLHDHAGIPWLVVKGVCDYADTQKDDTYHGFAARASALYALSCIQDYVIEERLPLRLPAEKQSKFHDFPRRNSLYFTGRETYLQDLHTALNEDQRVTLCAINGLGGMGKTQVAIEYAYRYRDDYETVFWVEADERPKINSGFRKIAERLNISKKEEKLHITQVIEKVKEWFETHSKWLLIFDNVDEYKMVKKFLPNISVSEKGQHTLFTTRDTQIPARRLEIGTMDEDEGSLLLLRRAEKLVSTETLQDASEEDRQTARAIVKALGGLPLALDQAGAYIYETKTSLRGYLERYEKYRVKLFEARTKVKGKQRDPYEYSETIATTWQISFDKIRDANPAAAELLRLFAFLDPDEIPEEIIIGETSILSPVLGLSSLEELEMDDIRGELTRFSLVKYNEQAKTLAIHRLVQAVTQDDMSEELRHTWAERAIRVVYHAFPKQVNKIETWEDCRRCLPQAVFCAGLMDDYKFTFLESVQMLNQLAYYLREQASYKDAEKYFQQALRMIEQFGLESYRDTVINNLARLYFDTYRYTKASPLYEQALAIREQKLGSEDAAIAGALNRLALTYWYVGNNGEISKYTQAETLYERALRISTQKLGAQHNDTLLILNNQALLYRSLGRYEEAKELNLHVLGIRRRKDPPVPLEVAQSLQNLAVTYYEQGDQSKYEEEELLLKEALAIREERLPPKHLQIARCLRYLGLVYQAQEKYNEASPLFKRALEIFDEQLGKEMPETVSLARNYHALLLKLTPEPKEEIVRIETRYQVFNLDDDGDVAG